MKKFFSFWLVLMLFIFIVASPTANKTFLSTLSPSTKIIHKNSSNKFLDAVQHHFRDAAGKLETPMSDSEINDLLAPDRKIEVHFFIQMDDGSIQTFTGWRVQHSFLRGAAKGGVRIAAGLTVEDVQALATEMTLKTSVSDLPLGGGKGGIDANPRSFSNAELARLIRAYVWAVMDKTWNDYQEIAFHVLHDSPAPDAGTSPAGFSLMNIASDELLRWYASNPSHYHLWLKKHHPRYFGQLMIPLEIFNLNSYSTGLETPLLDKYLRHHAQSQGTTLGLIGAFTGKSVDKGGSQGRSNATGLGLAYSALELLKYDLNLDKELSLFPQKSDGTPWRIAVQGYGNVGYGAVKCFTLLGALVVSIAEYDPIKQASYAIYKKTGFSKEDLAQLDTYRQQHKTLKGFPLAEKTLTLNQFWALDDIDILSPCAMENQITKENAPLIKAKYIIEGANGPTTKEADAILESKEIYALPDIFANGGGVTVSYFEMEQNKIGVFLPEGEINKDLRKKIVKNFKALVAIKEKSKGRSLREAAYVLGLERMQTKRLELKKERAKTNLSFLVSEEFFSAAL